MATDYDTLAAAATAAGYTPAGSGTDSFGYPTRTAWHSPCGGYIVGATYGQPPATTYGTATMAYASTTDELGWAAQNLGQWAGPGCAAALVAWVAAHTTAGGA